MYRTDFLKIIGTQFLKEYRDAEAFEVFDGVSVRKITFADFTEDILKTAGYFMEMGIWRKHIALAAPNSYEWLVVYWGVLVSGNTAVLINPELPEKELIRQCSVTEVSYIFGDQMVALRWNEKSEKPTLLSWDSISGRTPISLEMTEEWKAEETVSLLFTSGTEGVSKAVMLTAENMETCMNNMEDGFQINRSLMTLPLYHVGGLTSILYLLVQGKTICIGRGIRYLFQDISCLKPDQVTMVPGMLDSFIKYLKRFPDQEKKEKEIREYLKYIGTGGASQKKEACDYLLERGFILGIGYGMTETAGCGMWGILKRDHLETIGAPGKGIKCRIENGEILISGKCIMAGYYKDPEATGKVIKNGWLYTGDLGYQDKEGNYYLTGRKKNVIILSNGENVSPEEIEGELGQYHEIMECMVYGMPKGICADIYTKDEKAAAQKVKEYNRSVPTYRQIFKANYYDAPLEKTGSGKIKRKENRYE